MPKPLNVFVFFSDQQRWDTLGGLGMPLDLTPNLDAWAARGALLPYATTPQPVCGPARACLQTGRYATAIGDGCHTNGRPLPTDADTFAQRFAAAGYATGYFGKWHLAPGFRETGTEAVAPEHHGGWAEYLSANALEHCSDGYTTRLYDPAGVEHELPGYRVDALTDASLRFVDRSVKAQKPFCCMVSCLEPHMQNHRDAHSAPFDYERRYRGRWTPPDLAALPGVRPPYDRMTGGNAQQSLPGYLGSIKRLDEAFGRVMDALISLDQLENTLVVYTSDHGCHFRTRNPEYKRSGHDVSARVPMVMHGGPTTGWGRDERPFSLVDLAPTLCDAAGLEPPEGAQGRSLLGELPGESFIQISESQFGRAVRTDRWKLIATADDASPSDRFANRLREAEVYDLVADPYELVNLAGLPAYADVRRDLRDRLRRRMTDAGEPAAELELLDGPPGPAPGQVGQLEVRDTDHREPKTA